MSGYRYERKSRMLTLPGAGFVRRDPAVQARQQSSGGFTLIELLIALSIFALISVVAFTGLQASINSREQTNMRADRLAEIQKAFNFMRQDLEQAVPRAVRDQM